METFPKDLESKPLQVVLCSKGLEKGSRMFEISKLIKLKGNKNRSF